MTQRSNEPPSWPVTWTTQREDQLERTLAASPAQRLAWLEEMIRLSFHRAQIGEGGMGQVFRARDTKLNRDVALKVLPDSFASDADRLARFTREAQTLAALNHPNIAHIHGLEESGGVRALVMELVEGEDLSQRIARGAIAPMTVTGATIEPGAPVALFPTRIGSWVDGLPRRQFDLAPDGRFLINTVQDGAAEPITLLMNWHPEAKK